MEIDYGQGYYLGKPVPVFIPTTDNIADKIKCLKKASSGILGNKLFRYIQNHNEDDCVIINDESGNLLEKLSCGSGIIRANNSVTAIHGKSDSRYVNIRIGLT